MTEQFSYENFLRSLYLNKAKSDRGTQTHKEKRKQNQNQNREQENSDQSWEINSTTCL